MYRVGKILNLSLSVESYLNADCFGALSKNFLDLRQLTGNGIHAPSYC